MSDLPLNGTAYPPQAHSYAPAQQLQQARDATMARADTFTWKAGDRLQGWDCPGFSDLESIPGHPRASRMEEL